MQNIINTGFIVHGVEPKQLHQVPILILDKPGINKKIYPEDVVKKAIESYKELCRKDPTRRYVFAKHPKDEDEEWIGLIAGVCNDLYIRDKVLYADVTLLPTVWGYTIYWLLKHGYTIGTSIRGRIKPEETYYKTESGQNIIVKKAEYMEFEGFDFVVFPSYVVTQAKYENVKEQRYIPSEIPDTDSVDILCNIYGICSCKKELEKVKEQSLKEVTNIISLKEIREKVLKDFSKQNITFDNNNFRRSAMLDKEKEFLQTEIERIKLEKARHELELERIKEQIKKAQSELELVKSELSEYMKKVKEQREQAKAEELYIEKLAEKKAELERIQEQIKELEQKKEELKQTLSELEKAQESRNTNLMVQCCGKRFDENNQPKIRVVPASELVSNKEWGTINHDITRKLVYLSGDENLAKEVFGVVDMNQGWSGLKYPVYEHRKSSEDGYDVDLVLNVNGLRTALVFLQGRPGMAISRKEKKQLVEFLLKKYEELKKAGVIEQIPESLTNIARSLRVLEQVKFNVDNEIVSTLLETAILTGLVDVELDDIKESVEVDVDSDTVLTNFAVAISKALEGEALEESSEQQGRGNAVQIMSYDDGIEKLWNLLTDTDFANQMELETKDDFENYIKQIVDNLINGNIVSALKSISILQDALRGTGAVHAVIPLVLFAIDKLNAGTEQNTNQQDTDNQGSEEPSMSENEQTNKLENTQEKSKEDDDMKPEVFDALKNIIESNFEGVKIDSEESLIPVIEKLTQDYITTYESEENLKLELAKRDALIKALENGIKLEVAKEKIESASTIDELESVLEELTKETEGKKDSTEKVTEKASGKGLTIADTTTSKQKDKFDEMLDEF